MAFWKIGLAVVGIIVLAVLGTALNPFVIVGPAERGVIVELGQALERSPG